MNRFKSLLSNKTVIISVCFLLVVVLAAGIFGMEYSSLRREYQSIQQQLNRLESEREVLSSQNAANESKWQQEMEKNEQLESKIDKLNDDISKIKLTKAASSKKASKTSSKTNGKKSTDTLKVDLSYLTKPNEGKKVCYLTFDDGPSDNTLKILDTLKKANATATFFVVGTSKLSYIQRAKAEGHTIALHTNTHDWSIYRDEKAFFKDLDAIHQKVTKLVGEIPLIMRFPGGSSNVISRRYNRKSGIMTRLTKAVQERGYVYVDWNVDSTDASGNNVPVSKILRNVKTYSKNKDNICILMHDTAAKDTTVKALPSIISYLRQKGYRFEGLTTESPIFHHGVNN